VKNVARNEKKKKPNSKILGFFLYFIRNNKAVIFSFNNSKATRKTKADETDISNI
jgi:hypothetical protein